MSDMSQEQAAVLQCHHHDTLDPVTGLREWRTNYGRPNWENIFSKISVQTSGEIGLFACGPKPLTNQLKELSKTYSDQNHKFKFHKENF